MFCLKWPSLICLFNFTKRCVSISISPSVSLCVSVSLFLSFLLFLCLSFSISKTSPLIALNANLWMFLSLFCYIFSPLCDSLISLRFYPLSYLINLPHDKPYITCSSICPWYFHPLLTYITFPPPFRLTLSHPSPFVFLPPPDRVETLYWMNVEQRILSSMKNSAKILQRKSAKLQQNLKIDYFSNIAISLLLSI